MAPWQRFVIICSRLRERGSVLTGVKAGWCGQNWAEIFLVLLGKRLVVEHNFEYNEVCNSGTFH